MTELDDRLRRDFLEVHERVQQLPLPDITDRDPKATNQPRLLALVGAALRGLARRWRCSHCRALTGSTSRDEHDTFHDPAPRSSPDRSAGRGLPEPAVRRRQAHRHGLGMERSENLNVAHRRHRGLLHDGFALARREPRLRRRRERFVHARQPGARSARQSSGPEPRRRRHMGRRQRSLVRDAASRQRHRLLRRTR